MRRHPTSATTVVTNPFRDRISDILANAERYHRSYYVAETFRGPSLYFHQRALATGRSSDFVLHLEYVYATLVSWGMHRMGPGGSKMQPFETFRRSAESLRDRIALCQGFDPERMSPSDWSVLCDVFRGIKVMATGTSIVGNSKVMHHMMPNIVPPIDRAYTLRYLWGNTNIANDVDGEWQTMRDIISTFFIPVISDSDYASSASMWMGNLDLHPWDTSLMKVVDNLIIGSSRAIASADPI